MIIIDDGPQGRNFLMAAPPQVLSMRKKESVDCFRIRLMTGSFTWQTNYSSGATQITISNFKSWVTCLFIFFGLGESILCWSFLLISVKSSSKQLLDPQATVEDEGKAELQFTADFIDRKFSVDQSWQLKLLGFCCKTRIQSQVELHIPRWSTHCIVLHQIWFFAYRWISEDTQEAIRVFDCLAVIPIFEVCLPLYHCCLDQLIKTVLFSRKQTCQLTTSFSLFFDPRVFQRLKLPRNPVGPKSLKWWCETYMRNADVSHWINKNTFNQFNQQMYVYTLSASNIPLSSVITSFLLANFPLAAEPFATTNQGRLVHSLNALCAAIALLHHAVRRGREEGQHAEDVTWIC